MCEHFAGGGRLPGRDPAPLRREGEAMLRALLADLLAAGVPRIAAVVRPGLVGSGEADVPPGIELLAGGPDPAAALARELADGGGWAWPVGPETRGVLHRLARTAGRHGDGAVGTPARGVRAAARRLALLRRLERRGIRVPRTLPAPTAAAARRAARRLGVPVVVKPGRGAGCAGVRRVDDPAVAEAARADAATVEPGPAPLVQRFVPGTAASVTLLAGSGEARPLALNGQRIRFDPGARYAGGATPLRHPDASRALRTAAAACRACGGLRGLVGVDLVLGDDGPVVLEINPRVTTSYLGLRERLGPGPAAAALRASGFPVAGDAGSDLAPARDAAGAPARAP